MKERSIFHSLNSKTFFISAIFLIVLCWIVETAIEVYVFQLGNNYITHLLFPSLHELWMRLQLLLLSVLAVVLAYHLLRWRKIDSALRESEDKFHSLFNQASDSIFLMRPNKDDLIIEDVNEVACNIHGYTREELIGKSIALLDDPETITYIPERIPILMSNKMLNVEAMHVRKDGSRFPVDIKAQRIQIGENPYILEIDRDITRRKMMEEKLKEAAITDVLTGLLNRRGFLALTEQQCKLADRTKRSMSLLYIDLDGMKTINDELGHQAGDQALVDLAVILKKTFRESDVIARMGGDEFAVLLTEPSESAESAVTRHLHNNIRRHNETAGRNYELLVSLGISFYDPLRPCSIENLLKEADSSMYKDKKSHKA